MNTITLNKAKATLRSGLEKAFFAKHDNLNNEPVILPYQLNYKPDFVGVKNLAKLLKGESCYVIETKGWLRPEDRSKMLAVIKAYPNIKFVFVAQNINAKYSKTLTYKQFCVKHGMIAFNVTDKIPDYILE